MPRTCVRKTQRGNYGQENLSAALAAIAEGSSAYAASREYGVPEPTLRRHRDHKVKNPGTLHLGGTPQVLLKAIEQAIHDHIKHMESLLFGLTTVDVRKLAYEVAEKANVPHPFNQEKNGWC